MIPIRIRGTGSAVDGRAWTTEELAAIALPDRDPVEMARRTGIATRYWIDAGMSAAGLGATALSRALAAADLEAASLARVIFVSSTGGDQRIPATANGVLAALGVGDSCDAFDINNSCAGFLSAFDVAARSVATGLGPVAVVASETFSRYLATTDIRPYLVLADAAAAVVVDGGRPGEGVLSSMLRNCADLRGKMATPHADSTGRIEMISWDASRDELTTSALNAFQRAIDSVLADSGVSLDEVAWVLPHQPNGVMLRLILEKLGVDPARTVPVVQEVGSIGAACIPFSLDRLFRSRPVRAGDRILMVGVGGGTAYGAILYQVAPSGSPSVME